MSQTRTDPPTQDEAWNERGTVVVPHDRELPPPEAEQGSGGDATAQLTASEPAAIAETTPTVDGGPGAIAARPTESIPTSAPADAEVVTDSPTAGAGETAAAPLFDRTVAEELRGRWTDVQVGFVDEPRRAVEQADALVADVLGRLTDGFAAERQSLEQQWTRGDDVSTEDLRMALRRYRSFFDRLLSI